MGGCIETFLQGETVFLDWANQKDLVCSQWPFGPKLWVGYRLITMLYIVGLLIWAFTVKFIRYQWKFFTMISHWAYVIFSLNSIIKTVCVIKYYKWLRQKDLAVHSNEEKPLLLESHSTFVKSTNGHCLLQFSWFVANIANVFTIMTTVGYWWPDDTPPDIVSGAVNIQIHGVNMALALLDTVLVAQPTLLLHFYQPLCFEFIYLSFTAFYYLAGGLSKNGTTAIYPSLNWAKPEATLIQNVLFNGLLSICCHLVLWLLAVIRRAIATNIKKEKSEMKS